ncbi:uncharacterized protein JCM10292_006361 [Rhodotorula paludigena]|uniref:uncharacterized protein n=1 Tax=Rhodotorula paludigena TaxID=86838 RepID=UPI003177F644
MIVASPAPPQEPVRVRAGIEKTTDGSVQPVASTSKVPYTPPAAVRLPNELLEPIFAFARPSLPAVSTRSTSTPSNWRAWTRLPLVHSRWHPVAPQALAKVVVVRSRAQLAKLARALREGHIDGKVEEILLELKEPASGTASDSSASCERELLDVLELCGRHVKVLRSRGFGDPILACSSRALRAALPSLETFEYSPADGAHPLTGDTLLSGLPSLSTLRHLVLQPSSRSLMPLVHPPDALLTAMLPLLARLPDTIRSASAYTRESYRAVLTDVGMHNRLESLELHSLLVSPLSLLALLLPTISTLTSLKLVSIVVFSLTDTLTAVLSIVLPGLEEFEWSEAPSIGGRGAIGLSLSDAQYWTLLSRLVEVHRLKLFSSHVFTSSPHRTGFSLPPHLEHLTLGGYDDSIEDEDVLWWIERVDELCEAKDKEALGEARDDAEGNESVETSEEMHAQDDDECASDCACTACEDDCVPSEDEDDSDYASALSNCDSDTDNSRPSNPSSFAHLTPASSPSFSDAPSPAPPPSPPSSVSPPSPLPSSSSASSSPPKPRRPPRLSWRAPPLPPSCLAPQLSHLRLRTPASSSASSSRAVRDRLDALVCERGVRVEWGRVVVVVLETLEVTREMRVEMGQVGDEWGGGEL